MYPNFDKLVAAMREACEQLEAKCRKLRKKIKKQEKENEELEKMYLLEKEEQGEEPYLEISECKWI